MTEPTSLGTELPKEISRCQELLVEYASIGPSGFIGATFIRQKIDHAVAALAKGDVVAMIQAYEDLKGCK